MKNEYPDALIGRISMYYRLASNLKKEGKQYITSKRIAQRLGITDAQVRKDLSFFGTFGVRKLGYPINFLEEELAKVLGLSKTWRIAIFGIGHLGYALGSYTGFKTKPLNIVALFDTTPERIGKEVAGVKITDAKDAAAVLKKTGAQVAIIATPSSAAQGVADVVVESGIKAILNFAPICLDIPANIKIINIDMASYVEILTFFLSQASI